MPKSIVLIGAHPDDCEINAGGTIALWRKAGFDVCIASMTNGDAGHQKMKGKPLAKRRANESKASAAVTGSHSVVFNNHDGELQPTLDVRKQVVALIRERRADAVITHRPNDYHPDHRYTAQVVQDAAYMVTVPHFAPGTPALRRNPVFLYMMDGFTKPYPFEPDVAVDVSGEMDAKWRMLDAMESQVYEWLAWHAGLLDAVPSDADKRFAWLKKTWTPHFEKYTRRARKGLDTWYGKAKAKKIGSAEMFEISEYGHQPSKKEIRELFPFLPARPSK